jgi:magnesium transporter
MLSSLLKPEIEELIRKREWTDVASVLVEWPSPEVAELLRDLGKADRVLVFHTLPREYAAEVFAHMEGRDRDSLLVELTDHETRQLLSDLSPDDRTQLLGELPGEVTQRMLNLLSPADLTEARLLLGYPEESVGRIMTPDYVALRPEWTVGEAIQHIRTHGRDSETVNRVYVTDSRWRLLDDIELRRLILAQPEKKVEEVMDHTYVSVSALADREEAVHLIRRYDLVALPVTDSAGVMMGIVTVDDLLDVAEHEATEDFHRVGSVGPIRGSLREAKIGMLYRRRVGWLLILVFVNILTGAAIASYEELISRVVALVFFLPLLIASAGNAGSQAATLMIRALATGDVKMRDWFHLLGKEIAVAGTLGVTMAFAVSFIGLFRGGSEVAMVVGMTMVMVVVIGSVVGMSLPFLLSRLNLDPATASTPLVTSIADIAGVFVYLTIASHYLTV